MSARQIAAGLLALTILTGGPARVWSSADAQPAAPVPPAPSDAQAQADSTDATPPRVSYINGQVSFWRPGAEDWTPAKLNTPLAPGDVLYAGPDGNVEIQVGPRAFVRAAEGTQIGLDNQETDFTQFRVTGGLAALDVREIAAGHTIEVGTPNAVFTIEQAGFYRLDVEPDSTSFRTHRGGLATMTPAGGAPTQVAANQQVVLTGVDSPRVESGTAPALSAWDRWNSERTDYALRATSARYVPREVYGAEALDQHGTWRTEEGYGTVWAPAAVPAGWVPYSTGRWIWDPRFGWTWLDDAPWGWAPYHYGRWVFVRNYWAWAPGPVVVRPVYSPALVVFLGGGVRVGVGVRPLCWAPLAWGEPIVPWWGRRGFVGVATWRGWGGPRVVNNVVVNRTTTVNVTNINVYRNVTVNNAVVGVSSDRFAQHQDRPRRIDRAEVRELTPVRGALDVKPVAASVTVASGSAARPPAAIQARPVVATRPPHDFSTRLRDQGLATRKADEPTAPPRIVPAPRSVRATEPAGARPPAMAPRDPDSTRPEPPANRGERRQQPASPAPAPSQSAPQQPSTTRPEPPANRGERRDRDERRQRSAQPVAPTPPSAPAPSQAPAPQQPSATRPDPVNRGERRDRDERRERSQPPATPPAAPAPSQQPAQPRPPSATRPEATPNRAERPDRNDRRPQPAPSAAPSAPAPAQPAPPRQPASMRSEPPANRGERPDRGQPQQAPDRPARVAPPERGERQERPARSERDPRPGRAERQDRGERGQR